MAGWGQRWIAVPLPPEAEPDFKTGKLYDVTISLHRDKRSLDANALFWKCVNGLAEKSGSSNWETYLFLLEQYGDFDYIVVKPEAVRAARNVFRIVKDRGVINVGKGKGIQLQVWLGSSHYNTAQMSRLIEGTISECKEQGTWYPPEDELKKGLVMWGEKQKSQSY